MTSYLHRRQSGTTGGQCAYLFGRLSRSILAAAALAGCALVHASDTLKLAPVPSSQTGYAASSGTLTGSQLPVSVSGTLASATLTVTLPPASQLGPLPIYVYVAARVPAGVFGAASATWLQFDSTRTWSTLSSPMKAFAVVTGNTASPTTIPLLQANDVRVVTGTEIYVGYGSSDTEMIGANRFRGVYRVTDPFTAPPSAW